jgi:citrate synthase
MVDFIPGLAGVPAAHSGISDIDGENGVLEYRGININELMDSSSFLDTSYLLLYNKLPTQSELSRFEIDIRAKRKIKFKISDIMKNLPERAHPMQVLQSTVSALGMFYPHDDILDKKNQYRVTIKLLAKIPTIIAAWHNIRKGDDPVLPRDDLSHSENFLYMLDGDEVDENVAEIFDKCLILHAEHTMNASTFATLVVASTLADPYTVISSAMGSLSGPLHGGANEEVVKMLKEFKNISEIRPYIEQKIEKKEKIPGFGHRVYKTFDPRAIWLEKQLNRLIAIKGETKLYAFAKEVETVALEHFSKKDIYPNVDFYSGIIYNILGISSDMYTSLFAMARISGWLAHWVEYIEDNKLFRPTQIYNGVHNKKFVRLEYR